ncbi:MAG: polysaccharide biosynthesis tyrosine autokinase [Actinomycetota bacterium]
METQTPGPRSGTPELRDYFRILWVRKWTILFVTAIVTAGVLYLSYQQTPIYESRVRVVVPQSANTVLGAPPARTSDLETEAEIAGSPVVARQVATQLPWAHNIAPDQLVNQVDIAPLKNTSILLFVSQNADPRHAADLAHYFATSYVQLHKAQVLTPFTEERKLAQSQLQSDNQSLDQIGPFRAGEPSAVTDQRNRLTADLAAQSSRIDELNQTIGNIQQSSANAIIEDARVASSPVRPNHLRDALLGVIVGLVLGFGAAFLRDYLDDSLRGVDDVERQTGATLIGVIPHVSAAYTEGKKKDSASRRNYLVADIEPKAPATEAYRTLRTNLMFMSATGPLRTLLITSPLQGEGKTTTAANLAVVMAQAGQRVLLIGGDLRRPAIHQFFGLSNRVGLSSVLSGQVELTDAVWDPGTPGLRVMTGGPVPPNPAELLGSSAMRQLLEDVSNVTDWVIIDGPPVLGLADALVLSSLSDGVLVVVHEGTNRRILAHSRDQLGKVRSRTVGAVLNNFGPAFSYYYSDYYAYTSQYYAAPETPQEAGEKLSRRERRRRRREEEEQAAVAGNGKTPTGRQPDEIAARARSGERDRGSGGSIASG